jgi:hypothetical protein
MHHRRHMLVVECIVVLKNQSCHSRKVLLLSFVFCNMCPLLDKGLREKTGLQMICVLKIAVKFSSFKFVIKVNSLKVNSLFDSFKNLPLVRQVEWFMDKREWGVISTDSCYWGLKVKEAFFLDR